MKTPPAPVYKPPKPKPVKSFTDTSSSAAAKPKKLQPKKAPSSPSLTDTTSSNSHPLAPTQDKPGVDVTPTVHVPKVKAPDPTSQANMPVFNGELPQDINQWMTANNLDYQAPSQDQIAALVNQALQPYLDAYNQQSGVLDKQTQGQQSFDTGLGQQLGDWLAALGGGGGYNPTTAAYLGQNASRLAEYGGYQQKGDLYNSLVSDQLPGIRKDINDRFAPPTTDQRISEASGYQDYLKGWKADHAPPDPMAALQLASGHAALYQSFQTSGAPLPKEVADQLGLPEGTVLPPAPKASKPLAGAGAYDEKASYQAGHLVDRYGTALLDGNSNMIPYKTKPTAAKNTPGGGHMFQSGGTWWIINPKTGIPENTGLATPKKVGSKTSGNQLVVSNGKYVLVNKATGQHTDTGLAAPKKGGGGGATTPAAARSWVQGLKFQPTKNVSDTKDGHTESHPQAVGAPTYKMKYKMALARLKNVYGISDLDARKMLNGVYGRGQGGRAWLTNTEQGVLFAKFGAAGAQAYNSPPIPVRDKDGKPIKGKSTQVHGFLTEAQYAALKAHGLNPPVKKALLPYSMFHSITGGKNPREGSFNPQFVTVYRVVQEVG